MLIFNKSFAPVDTDVDPDFTDIKRSLTNKIDEILGNCVLLLNKQIKIKIATNQKYCVTNVSAANCGMLLSSVGLEPTTFPLSKRCSTRQAQSL